jgi:glycosyltransferase involved in cell wall biosynthesis
MSSHIAYLCSSKSWGGLEYNQLRNARWMHDLGYPVLVLCVAETPVNKAALDMGLPVQLISYHRKYYDFRAARTLRHILQDKKISHLIVRATRDISIASRVRYKMGASINVSYFMEMQLGVQKTNILHSLRYRFIDLWSCPLHYLEDQVRTMTNFHNTLVHIPSGLELDFFPLTENSAECRKMLDLPKERFLFGLIGRFDPQKGQELVLEALKIRENLPCDIVFLGEPTQGEADWYYTLIQEKIAAHSWENRVHLRPYRKDTSTFYHAVDALIMATKAESIGMVTLEALACGIPVVGSDKGGTPEILDDGKAGILFVSEDASDLARAMGDMIETRSTFSAESLRLKVAENDHKRVCVQIENALGLQKPDVQSL